MKAHIRSKYVDEECEVTVRTYQDGVTPAIILSDPQTGEQISHPTACVPGIPSSHVAVKNYAENEGMLPALISASVIDEAIGTIASGRVLLYVCPLKV